MTDHPTYDPVADEQLRMIISGWDSDSIWKRMAEELVELRKALKPLARQARQISEWAPELSDKAPVCIGYGDITQSNGTQVGNWRRLHAALKGNGEGR